MLDRTDPVAMSVMFAMLNEVSGTLSRPANDVRTAVTTWMWLATASIVIGVARTGTRVKAKVRSTSGKLVGDGVPVLVEVGVDVSEIVGEDEKLVDAVRLAVEVVEGVGLSEIVDDNEGEPEGVIDNVGVGDDDGVGEADGGA